MSFIVQNFLSGLAIGGVYALVALGFYIMWSAARAANFAHGDTVMLGGVLAVTGVAMGIPLPLAMIAGISLCVVYSLIVERVGVRPFTQHHGSIGWILCTIAIGIMLETFVTVTFGSYSRPLASPGVESILRVLGAGIYPQQLFIIAFVVAFVIALETFYRRTQLGRALKAVAFNREASGLMGINVRQITAFAFGLAGLLGGVAGVLVGPITSVSATMGLLLGLKGFVIFIMAGLSSAYGVVIVGISVGVIEQFIHAYSSSTMREIVTFSLAIAVLLLFPQGLFGRKEVAKV